MTSKFNIESVTPERERLARHPVYESVRTIEDLRVFMQHHVFSVWDFMSLVKYLQNELAPTTFPWAPKGDPMVRRFINEIVLEEESDQGLPGSDPAFLSHYELYREAMREIGADADTVQRFVDVAAENGIRKALNTDQAPTASAAFTAQTFQFVETDKPHVVAAAFALGREHIIPEMFRAFLKKMAITKADAPAFHYYLERHIHLDEDFHGPLSLRMVDALVGDDPKKAREAEEAAAQAIEARTRFWDGVFEALPGNQAAAQ
ncbi:DUF3050 domain-containing protein [Pseudomonadota bacterium]